MTTATDVRNTIFRIWAEVLGVEPDACDDFFLAGGHSLLAIQMIAELENTLGVELTVRDVLDNPEIDGFCAFVMERAQRQEVRGEGSEQAM
ncbi:phosphopantetheine-binding protein [Streptomyces sp. NPDC015350]|uniref:phosphopantetheine-binding protein n=1 Tax=Streptomyces sp. NPDC015350 TaxID=3364955 RepID=UPI0036F69D5B